MKYTKYICIHTGSGGDGGEGSGGGGGEDSSKGKILCIIGVVDTSLSSRPLPLTKYAHLLAILTFSLSCPIYVCKLCIL